MFRPGQLPRSLLFSIALASVLSLLVAGCAGTGESPAPAGDNPPPSPRGDSPGGDTPGKETPNRDAQDQAQKTSDAGKDRTRDAAESVKVVPNTGDPNTGDPPTPNGDTKEPAPKLDPSAQHFRTLEALCERYRKARTQAARTRVEDEYEALALKFVSRKIADALKDKTGVVMVPEFRNMEGKSESLEGVRWSERLAAQLTNLGLSVMTRSRLAEVLKEQEASVSDLYGESVPLGKLRSASVVVKGLLGRQALVTGTSTETGVSLFAVEVPRPYFSKNEVSTADIAAQIKGIRSERDTFGVRVWTKQREYKVDDAVTFHCRAKTDCYITLLTLQQDGTLIQLYPNAFSETKQLKAGDEFSIPRADEAWEFAASPPAGTQIVTVIASTRPIAKALGKEPPKDSFVTAGSKADAVQRMRDLKIRLKAGPGTKPMKWSASTWEFEINK